MQKPFATHYSNLKVSESAPVEVIKAAYRALAAQYHPDKNPGNDRATEIMKILNDAQYVLTDHDRRANYDAYLASKRATIDTPRPPSPPPSGQTHHHTAATPRQKSRGFWQTLGRVMLYDIRLTLFAGFGLFVLISAWSEFLRKPTYHPPQVSPLPYTPSENSTPSTSNPRIPTQSYTSTRNSYVRPAYAPNGKPWPTKAGYLPDSAVLHSGGLSEVTVDNSQNSSDVFVKLMYISSRNPIEVRCFYIPAYSKFTCSDVIPGNYDVRYRDLNSGSLAKTEPFLLEEIKIGDSTQYSMLTMTLYKVENGNMQTKPITEADF